MGIAWIQAIGVLPRSPRAFVTTILIGFALGTGFALPMARAQDRSGMNAAAVLAAVAETLGSRVPTSCILARPADGSLEARCQVRDFPIAKYCESDLPLGAYANVMEFFGRFATSVLDEAPPHRVLDYEVTLGGMSDGVDFSGPTFDRVYQCERTLDFGQGAIGDSIQDLHARLGSFRALTAWLLLDREAESRRFPLLFPRPPGASVENAPGRVVLAHSRSQASSGQDRRVDISVRVFPKFILRCPQGTHATVVSSQETCLPDCPAGLVAHAVAGSVSCLPACRPGEEMVFETGGAPRCTARCPARDATTIASRTRPLVNVGNVHLGIGLSAAFVGGKGFYGERALLELSAAGNTLAWHVGLGVVAKNEDNAYGMAVTGGLRINGWEKPALYPRIVASFMNFSQHQGSGRWRPFWLIAGEPGLEWHIHTFGHGALVASVFAILGARIEDTSRMKGATVITETTTSFAYGAGLGLGLNLW